MSDGDADSGTSNVRRRPITWLFNLGLLAFLACTLGVETMLLEPEERPAVPLDRLAEAAPVLTVACAVAFVVAVSATGVAIIMAFWNRFLTDVIGVRRINLVEAVALFLVIAIFFAPV